MKNLLLSAVLGLGFLTSCSSMGCCSGQCTAGDMAFDATCVITGEPVDASIPPVTYKGKEIGFCCDKCVAKWNAMDEAQKDAAVAKACERCAQR